VTCNPPYTRLPSFPTRRSSDLLDHPRVDYWVRRFTTDKRGEFSRFLSRSGRYVPMISQKLAERGMPQDLIYLAMIESGFNPKARSEEHTSELQSRENLVCRLLL